MPTSNVVLNYTRVQYTSRIDTLTRKISALHDMIEKYESKKASIPNFWEDEEASKYTEMIEKQINVCRRTITDAQQSLDQLNRIVENMDSTQQQIGQSVANAYDIVMALEE